MPNATVRANARTLSKPIPHPDADLITLAEKTAKAAELCGRAFDMIKAAEDRLVKIESPVALIKTEEDFKMRLFVGNWGKVYYREEIRAIGVLHRSLDREDLKTFKRCEEILEAWKDWDQRKELEAAKSGYADARRADTESHEVYEGLASLLARTRALTVDGLFAKARTFESVFPPPDSHGFANSIQKGLEKFGVGDEDSIALSLVRDIVVLAQRQGMVQ
jgi:hypothetical protein